MLCCSFTSFKVGSLEASQEDTIKVQLRSSLANGPDKVCGRSDIPAEEGL